MSIYTTSRRKMISLDLENGDGGLHGNGFSSLCSSLRYRIRRARHKPNISATSFIFKGMSYASIKVVWYPYKMHGPKSVFKFGEEGSIVCYCTQEEKMNFEGFTQSGCYGNSHSLLRLYFTALTPTDPILSQNKI